MASFKREETLVRHLLDRLGLGDAATDDPNMAGNETGVDVTVRLADLRTIGVQVTELDPYAVPGSARGQEKAIAKAASGRPYFMWGQNDPSVVLDAIARAITRKVEIAAKHSFDGYDEVWLLLCGGVPEHGAVVSTFVMTPWLSAGDLNSATDGPIARVEVRPVFPSSHSRGGTSVLSLGSSLTLGKAGWAGRYWAGSA